MVLEYNIQQLNHDRKVIDFMRWYTVAFIISGLLIVSSIIIISVRGFNWGLDFTGGNVIEIKLEKPVNLDMIRGELVKLGFEESLVQNFGSSRDVIVRMASEKEIVGKIDLGNTVVKMINQVTHQNAIVKRVEFVGPSVGSELAQAGALALLCALIVIMIYIGIRFEWRLSLATVLALVHDVIITCSILSVSHIEIDLTITASLMSVIGYSLNDKIVVSDRIRENFRKIHHGCSYDIINISLTQILHRTLLTSLTTLAMIIILFIFGGTLLKGFSLTMLIGVSIGTISSIYVSSALALKLGMKREHMLVQKVNKDGTSDNGTTMFP